jgi:predicted RNase H-like nuclease (RuvC/YqgF family)
LVCKDGRISESAAFILLQHKFNALILKGGIDRMTPDQLKAEPASFNIDDGTETGNFSESSKENTSLQLETMSQTEDQATEFSQILQQLKAKCKKLESENMTLELKCSSLSRQLESAKLELDKLKIN